MNRVAPLTQLQRQGQRQAVCPCARPRLMASVESIKMKVILNIIFWTVVALFLVPALLGAFAGIAVVVSVMLLGFVLILAAVTLLGLCCIPLLWWCVAFDTTKVCACLTRLKGATKAQLTTCN